MVERLHQLVDLALHDLVELVERQVDPMVGDPALRKVIGAYAFRAVAGSDLELAGLRLVRGLFLAFVGQQPGFQQ